MTGTKELSSVSVVYARIVGFCKQVSRLVLLESAPAAFRPALRARAHSILQ